LQFQAAQRTAHQSSSLSIHGKKRKRRQALLSVSHQIQQLIPALPVSSAHLILNQLLDLVFFRSLFLWINDRHILAP
jgi:hypothetical protein